MSNTPRVSVVVTAFGSPLYLVDALNSVFSQTFTDVEVILVDDNDPNTVFRESTRKIVSQFALAGRHIIYLQHPRNLNGAAARNTGIDRSSGEYICFLDADDMYHPCHIQNSIQTMESQNTGSVGGVYSGVEFRRGGVRYGYFAKPVSGEFIVETLACRFRLGSGSNIFMKGKIIKELGGFDVNFRRHQDYEFMVRFFKKYELAASKNVTVIKNNENFNQPSFPEFLRIKKQYLNKYRQLIEELSKMDQDYIYRSNYVLLGEEALRAGRRRDSRRMYSLAHRYGRMSLTERSRRKLLWLASWHR